MFEGLGPFESRHYILPFIIGQVSSIYRNKRQPICLLHVLESLICSLIFLHLVPVSHYHGSLFSFHERQQVGKVIIKVGSLEDEEHNISAAQLIKGRLGGEGVRLS